MNITVAHLSKSKLKELISHKYMTNQITKGQILGGAIIKKEKKKEKSTYLFIHSESIGL